MNIHPIKNDSDYQTALAEIETLMDAQMNTPEGDKLDILATLVESYEAKNFPTAAPNPIAAIKFRMEQQDLSLNDLAVYFGSLDKVKAFGSVFNLLEYQY